MQLLTPDLGLLIWNLLAFLIVFFLLKKFAWPAIIKGLNEREANITNTFASVEKIKLEMAQLKNDNETLLAKAREERSVLLREAKETSEKMIAESREKAKTEYDRIVADAMNRIQQQKMAAVTDIKNEIGKLVIEVSEKVLRRDLADKNNQEAYIQSLTDEIKFN
jgi:F-type H+-transporting ATPase subunit b